MMVRPYRSEDCEAIAMLFFDTVHEVCAQDYSPAQLDAWADGNVDLAAWDASFREHNTLVAQDTDTGDIVGFADMAADGYLDRLYVHKDRQGEGIATALCDALEEAAEHSPERPKTFVAHASITARGFFERRGYKAVREQRVIRHGIALTNFVMNKIAE